MHSSYYCSSWYKIIWIIITRILCLHIFSQALQCVAGWWHIVEKFKQGSSIFLCLCFFASSKPRPVELNAEAEFLASMRTKTQKVSLNYRLLCLFPFKIRKDGMLLYLCLHCYSIKVYFYAIWSLCPPLCSGSFGIICFPVLAWLRIWGV